MLFGNDLDQSLYLILKNDKKNRKEILRLINSIPEELYYDVQKASKVKGILHDFSGREYYNDDKTKLYRLYSLAGGMEITITEEEKVNDKYYKETVELTISSILWQLGSFVKYESIIKNNDVSISDEKETEYEIVETIMGGIFVKREEGKNIPNIGLCKIGSKDELSLKKINKQFNYNK